MGLGLACGAALGVMLARLGDTLANYLSDGPVLVLQRPCMLTAAWGVMLGIALIAAPVRLTGAVGTWTLRPAAAGLLTAGVSAAAIGVAFNAATAVPVIALFVGVFLAAGAAAAGLRMWYEQ